MTPTTTNTSGLEALYLAAVDSDVSLVTAVAGYPITAVMNRFVAGSDDQVFDAINLWLSETKYEYKVR